MRRILINRARDRKRIKRGGNMQKISLDKIDVALQIPDDNLLAVDEAIQKLAQENTVLAELVKLRFFAGLSMKDAAAALGISPSTADRYWAYARAHLFDTLRSDGEPGS